MSDEVECLDHVVTKDGLKPTVTTVTQMLLRIFLPYHLETITTGFKTDIVLSLFCARLCKNRFPLHTLTRKKTVLWSAKCQVALI